MKRLYIITGAGGHLGGTLIRALKAENAQIRGLLLSKEQGENDENVTYFYGDVRKRVSLLPLFAGTRDSEVIVIHTAGIVNISNEISPLMQSVNVEGTKNLAKLCLEKKVHRFIYVSSVHAIPEAKGWQVMQEVGRFSPADVVGGYAKTKAVATQAVLDMVSDGLPAVVVHPSGILGPFDNSGNHLVQMIEDFAAGKLHVCVRGGYDFVDVRDVAKGCLLAAEKGRIGQCYILSNRHYEVKELLQMASSLDTPHKVPTLPLWLARAGLPLFLAYATLSGRRPLYTAYSLHTLHCNDKFSHQKAARELGYVPRDLYQTIDDTLCWRRKKPLQI